jgi:MFS family permease
MTAPTTPTTPTTPPTDGAAPELPDWLRGERARPTLPALAGAAGALVTLCGLVLLFEDIEPDEARVVGLALSLLTVLVGFGLMLSERQGALRTAGVGLAAGAALPFAIVLVNDPVEIDSRTDVLLTGLVTVLVWLVLFVLSPARGHGLFLGLALLGAWVAAVSQTAPESSLSWFNPLFQVDAVRPTDSTPSTVLVPEPPSLPTFTVPTFGTPPTLTVPDFPEPRTTEPTFPPFPTFAPLEEEGGTSLGPAALAASTQPLDEGDEPFEPPVAHAVVSILFGLVYLAAAALLDKARLPRPAGAFVAVGVPVLAFGVVSLGPRYGATTLSAAAVGMGSVLAAVGVGGGRRFSGWAGAAVLVGGAIGLVAEALEDPGDVEAVAMLLVGAAVVGLGWFLSQPALGPSKEPLKEPKRSPQ